ncbi:ligase-associated DNA damage response endonuclease PdeM [Thalassobius sp. Cn5-15]|uniref:ligase-associated DNA damage response endonuclease PdeM n=1 Tax=Thalassobius sp. Cn5-15 TaxID=2917763 RepID=UPI001EF26770|nr:ligase-associated DNA damage response endonuclease PdeM [Thalassobius sp. Cn5-15]MCG7493202.1 ligase-associated DNA damage response endonuclease PdeM [Thalassobius sp. Cn5-15]
MSRYSFTLAGQSMEAMPSGALFWPEQSLLCVSDLHFGKSERIARLGGAMLPPYDTRDTLTRLEKDLTRTKARSVICLGDSFDDSIAARGISEQEFTWITRLQAGRHWVWIEGNHDPGPLAMGGTHMAELPLPPVQFRHIAVPGSAAEISGHYHPKAQLKTKAGTLSRPCFLIDSDRVIMPAYGSYTGGLMCDDPALVGLMRPEALAVLTGDVAQPIPMPGRRSSIHDEI